MPHRLAMLGDSAKEFQGFPYIPGTRSGTSRRGTYLQHLHECDRIQPPLTPHWSPYVNGLSFSLLEYWQKCRMAGKLQASGIQSKVRFASADFGSIFHEGLEILYGWVREEGAYIPDAEEIAGVCEQLEDKWSARVEEHGATDKERREIERAVGILEAMLPTYVDTYLDDFNGGVTWEDIEGKVVHHVPGNPAIKVKGFIDGLYRDRKGRLWVMDTKTRSQINEDTIQSVLGIDLQLNLYCWLVWKVTGEMPFGTMYNVIRNPGLRQKKGRGKNPVPESFGDYIQRVQEDIEAKPDHYLVRFEVCVDPADIRAFEEELQIIAQEFEAWFFGLSPTWRSTSQCTAGKFPCRFLNWCANRDEAMYRNIYEDRERDNG